jgi:hypothetical protein
MKSGWALAPSSNVAILGFATRTETFAALLAPRGCALRVWDPRLAQDDTSLATRIEAAGVDVIPELAVALRGARLVVFDSGTEAARDEVPLQAGQKLLDLATAPAAEIEAVLIALGLPPASADWKAACTIRSGTASSGPAVVRRGELP